VKVHVRSAYVEHGISVAACTAVWRQQAASANMQSNSSRERALESEARNETVLLLEIVL